MKPFVPDEVWIERGEVDSPLALRVLATCADRPIHVVDDVAAAAVRGFAAGKRRLVLQRHRGTFLRHCPAGTAGLVCCNYLVINLASNCPFDCSYCFLQEYLADNPALTAYTNVDAALAEVGAVLEAHPERGFRIGTGELGDSLALDPVTGLSRVLVPFFAARPNATLELKTKTDCIDELLDLDPRGRVVVSWSVNAPAIVASEEDGTASLAARLAAARRVAAAGYRVGFHFDPLIEFPGWEAGYREAVRAVFAAVDPASVAWVSLGSLRMTPGLRQSVRARGHGGHVLGAELVPGADGKARVWQGLRLRMYRTILAEVQAAAPGVPQYLCMETPGVWERVKRTVPSDRELGMQLAGGVAW